MFLYKQNFNRKKKYLKFFTKYIQNSSILKDDDAFKFLAMHFGIAWEIKQKEFLQEKSPSSLIFGQRTFLGAHNDQNALQL